MIGDVDGVVRELLESALGKAAVVSFEPPASAREAAGEKARPVLDVHLVSIEEQGDLSAAGMTRVQTPDGTLVNAAPPRYIRLTYWLSAWGRDVATEHDLLGTVVSRLVGRDHVDPDLLPPGLAAGGLPVRMSVAVQSSLGGHVAEVWASLGEPMKAGLELSLLVPLDVSPAAAPGPPVIHRRLQMTAPPPPAPPAVMAPPGIPPVLVAPSAPAPAASAAPRAPAASGAPASPGAPAVPGAPASPGAPAAPGSPAATPPGAPAAPAEPVTPVLEEITYGPEPSDCPEVGEPMSTP